MYKLRRSRIAKFISSILVLIMSAAIVANIAGTFFLYEENLFYANRIQLQQKVYSYLYNYTASDLMRYLRFMESAHSNNDNYRNYHKSEIDLYQSKYSPENSNIHFTVSDENDNLLLTNKNQIQGEYFSFSSYYVTDINYGIWYEMGESVQDDSTEFEVFAEKTTSFDNEISYDETAIEQNISEEATTVVAAGNKQQASESINFLTERTTVTNFNTDNTTEIIYHYSDEINSAIFEYCKEFIRSLNYDISSVTFFQDEFSETDGLITENYSFADYSREERTIICTLMCENKTADIIYKYNGTFSVDEFTERLSYSALIMQNAETEDLNLEYNQKTRLQLKVNIDVPYTCTVDDIYKIAETFTDDAIDYRDNIVTITSIYLLLFITSFIFIFYSAGYIPKYEKPVARGIHAIPTDIMLLVAAISVIASVALISTSDLLFAIFGLLLAAITLLSILYTSVVRIRTGTFKKNSLLNKIFTLIKSASITISENAGAKLRITIAISAFIFVSMIEVFIIILLDMHSYGAALFIMLIRFIEIPVIVVILTALIALEKGAKQISSGDINYRINNRLLFGPLKKHADNLNSINKAVNNAIEERLKSENLKTELITNVSHDLKTPLTSIVNYVDLLKKEQIDNVKANEYIEVIDRQSQRLKKLTIDIVEASKAATGNIDIHYENTVLNVILLQTNGEYIERLEENNLKLIQEIPDNDITISADGRLLWRIIDNLMNNICKYSMQGTRVYLKLYHNDVNAFISFKNISRSELNISPQDLTERFVRGDSSRNAEGSGLGLSIAKSLTENMGGKMDIFIDGDLFKVTLSFPLKRI